MTPQRALIEAAERALPHLEYKRTHTQTAEGRKSVARSIEALRAAISSAKAAEEGLEPAVKLLADVMHLWIDGYISKSPNSAAPNATSKAKFDEIETFLAARGISVDYCGWHVEEPVREKEGL